jgi:carbon monoxide dehydrogenase subunit G
LGERLPYKQEVAGSSPAPPTSMAHLGGTASAEIEAPLDEVWALIEDVAIAPEWQGGLVSIAALERDEKGRPTLVESVSDLKVRQVKTEVRFAYEPPTRLSWVQEKGDLKSVEGSWVLEKLGEGRTRATYTLDADPGRVLGMVIRGPVEAAARAMLVNARPGELKARAEAAR